MVESAQIVTWPSVIEKKKDAIRELARSFGVERLEVFGSVMTDLYDPFVSDIDFLVTYPPDYDFGPFLGRYQDLQEELRYLTGSPVDLVMNSSALSERFRREAAKTQKVIYDAAADN